MRIVTLRYIVQNTIQVASHVSRLVKLVERLPHGVNESAKLPAKATSQPAKMTAMPSSLWRDRDRTTHLALSVF